MGRPIEQVKLIFLGTGTSHGIPMIGCDCPVCTSADPCDRRSRPSVVVEFAGRAVLIDTAPELRLQCVANGIKRVDAVCYTHAHADHVVGLDDLRRFNWLAQSAIDCYGTADTMRAVQRMFPYACDDEPDYPSAKPTLELHSIDDGPLELFGCEVVPIPLMHGQLPVRGYRFGPVAYCTDCNAIPASSWRLLEGLDVLVLDALRRRSHPTHFNLEQAIETARQIAARRTFFTHIAHELPHAATNATLPPGMALACDGQVVRSPEA